MYTPANLGIPSGESPPQDEDDDFPLLLQVSLHAFIECLSMFQISGSSLGSGNQRGVEFQRSAFHPIKGSLRLVYEGDGQPFLVMCFCCLLTANYRAEENGVVTSCELTTYAPDEDEDINEIVFNPTTLVSKVIMKVQSSSDKADLERMATCSILGIRFSIFIISSNTPYITS